MSEQKIALFGADTGGDFQDDDIFAYKKNGVSDNGTRTNSFSKLREDLGINGIKDGSVTLNPRSRIKGRYDSIEVPVSSTIYAAGWKKIAQVVNSENYNGENFHGTLHMSWTGSSGKTGSIVAEFNAVDGSYAKNCCNIIYRSPEIDGPIDIRIGGSDISGSGSVLEVFFKTGTIKINYVINNNITNESFMGWETNLPIESTGYCPDETTSAIYYTAGEIFSFNPIDTKFFNTPIIMKISDTSLRCTLQPIDKIKLSGSGIDIKFPTTSLSVVGGGAALILTEANISISDVYFRQKENAILFKITDTISGSGTPFSIFSSNYPLFFRWSGGNGYIKII